MKEYAIMIKRLHYVSPRTVQVEFEVLEEHILSSIDVPLELASIEEVTRRMHIRLPHILNDPGHALFLKAAKDLVGRELRIDVEVKDQNVA